ncbi:hypothetical protein DF185_07380 [Marinifilum breve]|uniref:DNA 3'-5' helicase n=1 Tax=Marinifilum breve TaxID=2184082 RepID=A0A2V4AEF1_9BACT|nr:ATP-dependent helicase [Marinifilum breve]PXY02464.1 hypothetical protein DF185_07380 [Marinifilum breve]
MSLKHLHRKLRNTDLPSEEFDPISAFESFESPVISNIIPPDRYTEPKEDYSDIITKVEAKKPQLASALKKLNLYQQQAVFSEDQKLLLSAMVGSGKTTVLTHKVLYLHFIKGIPLSQMAVLTFTNKAAREIKERILSFYENSTPPNSDELRYFGTFHSVARQLIKEHPKLQELGFTPDFSIMDQEAKEDFLQRLIVSHELDVKYRNKLDKRLKLYRNEKQIIYGNMKNPDDLVQLLNISRKEKQANNLMDFDDLISVINWQLKLKKTFIPEWIVVDEFQDCNQEQIELIQNLSDDRSHFFAVGDPNQSIYAWRGSTNVIFQNYIEDQSFVIMRLPLNYRTSGQLLNAASCLLQQDNDALQATRDQGKKLIIRNHFDDHQEAYYYVQKFKEVHQHGTPRTEIAVLFRTRQQIAIFESIFQLEGIPCEVVSKTKLREQAALFWLQNILLSGLHPNDMDSILRVFTSTDFGCLKAGKRLLSTFSKFIEGKEFASKLEAFSCFLSEKYKKHAEYIDLCQRLMGLADYLRSRKRDVNLYQYLSLDFFLKPTSINYKDDVADIKNALNELDHYTLKNYFGDWLEIYRAAMSQVSLEGHFQINSGIQTETKGVSLLTIHAAKGLEFDHVYLSGANSGIIPLERKKAGYDHLKEEKRLLFVALTRAKNHMEISWHTKSSAWNAQDGPSYFLNSIPSALLEKVDTAPTKDSELETTPKVELNDDSKWKVGTKVKHPKYGTGEIKSCNEQDVVCDFGKFGEKSFASAWAPLVKI